MEPEVGVRVEKVAVIGSGLIGKCWAVLFARAGYRVALYDVLFADGANLEAAMAAVKEKVVSLEKESLLWSGLTADQVTRNISACSNLREALDGAVYVQECVPENVDLKRKVFAELDRLATETMILASSTSCIVPSSFTSELAHRSQCIVAHPMNPPHYIPLVEVLPSPWTDHAVLERTLSLLKKLGQAPVVVKKEINGFIVNRLQYALMMEAWRLVEDGVATPEDIDTAISEGIGLRFSFMGPFAVMHLNAEGMDDYCKRYGANISKVCEEQAPVRQFSGPTLQKVTTAMESTVPLEKLEEKRKWRDERLSALAKHKREMVEKERCGD